MPVLLNWIVNIVDFVSFYDFDILFVTIN
jgi:hypothetical protein